MSGVRSPWPSVTLLLVAVQSSGLHEEWSSFPAGRRARLKTAPVVYFLRVLFCLFWAWNIFRLVSPWSSVALPGEEQETQCYITTLCSVNLLPTLSFFCLLFPPPVIFFLPPLFAVNSTEIQYVSACHRYIQNNLITAITFLPGWLTPRPQPLTAAPMCSILLSSYSYLTELHVPFISLFFMFSFFLFYSNTVCWLSQ